MGDSETLSPVLKYSHPEDLKDKLCARFFFQDIPHKYIVHNRELFNQFNIPIMSFFQSSCCSLCHPHSPPCYHQIRFFSSCLPEYSLNLFSCLSTIPYQHNFFNMFLCLFKFIIFVYIHCVSFTLFICPSPTTKVT